jgi:hypothetical protein
LAPIRLLFGLVGLIIKHLVKEERVEVGQYDKFPRLRGRLNWGGTDELFIRKPEEVKNADIYSELMSVKS